MKNYLPETETISSTIGNYPVVDQFDVLYTGLLSGSTYDNYVTGSLFSRTKFGQFYITTYGERGLAFSKIGDNNYLPSQSGASRTSYEFQPWSERAGNVRNVRIFSDAERFYDSLVPDLRELVHILGGKIGIFSETNPVASIQIVSSDQDSSTFITFGFVESFPFEPKFSNAGRISRLNKSFIAEYKYFPPTTAPTPPFWIPLSSPVTTKELSVIYSQKDWETSNLGAISWQNAFGHVGLKETDATKILFGFGDFMDSYVVSNHNYGAMNLVGARNSGTFQIFGDVLNYRIGPVIRGWKYGLIDGNPRYSSAVFRRDRYGQFRDMLEQRLDSKMMTDLVNAPNFNFGDFETQPIPYPSPISKNKLKNVSRDRSIDGSIGESPVVIRFMKKTLQTVVVNGSNIDTLIDVPTDPLNTQTSNLDSYATSSLPYFDHDSEGKNRPPINYTLLHNSVVTFNGIF
jgi:hypothetical protein